MTNIHEFQTQSLRENAFLYQEMAIADVNYPNFISFSTTRELKSSTIMIQDVSS